MSSTPLGGVDAALANHLVMGPVILARAGLGFAVKIHGSALEYTVKPEPQRFLPYAREGIDAAAGVLVGSRHTAESLWEAMGDPGLPARTRLGPPGVDTWLFRPLSGESRRGRLAELAAMVATEDPGGGGAFARDPRAAADAIRHLAAASGPRVVLVGKLIVSKGVDLLLAAWPLVHASNPGARLLVVGFGEYAGAVQRLWAALAAGDVEQARDLASKGRALEGGPPGPLRMLSAFLSEPPAGYADAAREAAGSVAFAGRLEHDEVASLVPATDALVFPSTFPESFGMVAAEAAAAGVLPVSAAHSGAAEVSRALAAGLPAERGRARVVPARRRRRDGNRRAAERLAAAGRGHSRAGAAGADGNGVGAVELGGRGQGNPGCLRRPARRADACAGIEWRRPHDPRHPCQADRRDPGADCRHGGADDPDRLGTAPRPPPRHRRSTRCST